MKENQNSNINPQAQDIAAPSSIQNEPPKSKFKFPVVIAVVVFLILIGIVFASYSIVSRQNPKNQQVSQTAQISPPLNSIASWRTYTDFRGFSFQYPSDWSFNGIILQYKGNSQGNLALLATRNLCEPCENLSESEFFDQMYKSHKIGDGGAGTTIEKISETKVGGKRTLVLLSHSTGYKESQPGDNYLSYCIYLNNPKFQVLRIVFNYNDGDKDKDLLLNTFNQILSTFQFFDQNQSDETANWKTYENDRLGFSFKYLPEWSIDKITEDGLQINHSPKEPGYQMDFNSIKWYKNYKDVEDNTGFKYDSRIEKWGHTVYQDMYAGTGAHFEELKIHTTSDSGAPIYCLNYEGSSQHLISLSNLYIVVDAERCTHDSSYGYEVFLFKILQSFSEIL